MILEQNDCLLLIIDVQEKLVGALKKDLVVNKTATLAKAAKILGIPVVVTEQYPKGLGNTVTQVANELPEGTKFIEKTDFSAFATEGFKELLDGYGKEQVIVCGIETHVCVHQTVNDLMDEGYAVFVPKDACASREKEEFKAGIDSMRDHGAIISTVEISLFELLKSAKHPSFKEVQALIK